MTKAMQLIEYITQDIIAFIMIDKLLSMEESMKLFYSSKVCHDLSDEDTGLYLQGSAYVYELLKEELNK